MLQSVGENDEAMKRLMNQISERLEIVNTNLLIGGSENADVSSKSNTFTRCVRACTLMSAAVCLLILVFS